jgi:hypothetical protein
MKKLLIISFLLIVGFNGFGQNNTNQFADRTPLFNGANEETNYQLLKVYFDGCGLNILPDGVGNSIVVSFVIDSVGTPILPILIIGSDSVMFNTVVTCMKSTPKWIPAIKNGKDVSCRFNFPFK